MCHFIFILREVIISFEYLPQNCLDMENTPHQKIKQKSRILNIINKSFDCYKTPFHTLVVLESH